MNKFNFPDWVPQVKQNSKILVIGASGGIGKALVKLLLKGPKCVIGFHRSSSVITNDSADLEHDIIDLKHTLTCDKECHNLVDIFTKKANGIDCLVVLCGGIRNPNHWKKINEKDWNEDIKLNLNLPFFLARAAMEKMNNG